jgi:3-methyladenine DNA glycosylase/8-oxoguanine DNA glycosylase
VVAGAADGRAAVWEFPLVGPGGEPIDLRRTLDSHGFVDLPPMARLEAEHALEITLNVDGGARTVRIGPGGAGRGRVQVLGRPPGARRWEILRTTIRRVLRLDEDLSGFYRLAAEDPGMAWAASGAGRMIQAPTVFEDVVKTICTTNCAWGATVRMVGALVEHLGEAAPRAPAAGPHGRAFPTPAAMAEAGDAFYRDVARAGYRAGYLLQLSRSVAEGDLNLEELAGDAGSGLSDEEVEARLLALPGVGPYAAAQVMMTIGRYHRLILDSWTRPTYARVVGRTTVKDAAIERRFRRFGPYAGLAFWLFVTRDWVDDGEAPIAPS